MADNEFLTGYLSGQNEGGRGGMFGGSGWEGLLGLIVIASLFGYGNFGNGRNGGGAATQADVNWGFQFNDLQGSLRGITNGISDATYALTGTTTNGFHNTERLLCDLGHQLSQCCCDNRAAIADLKFTISQEDCATRNLMQNNTRDIIASNEAGFRAVLDRLNQSDYNALREKYDDVRTQLLLSNQTNVTRAMIDSSAAEVIRRTGHAEAVPAYVVPNPNCCYGNPVGAGYNGWNGLCAA